MFKYFFFPFAINEWNKLNFKTHNTESLLSSETVVRKCSVKKVWSLQLYQKKRLWHRCFPVNLAQFLRTPFFQECDICKSYLICSTHFPCSVTNGRYYTRSEFNCNCIIVIYFITWNYHDHWIPFRRSNRLSYKAMSSTRTQSQLCTATLIWLFVLCHSLW